MLLDNGIKENKLSEKSISLAKLQLGLTYFQLLEQGDTTAFSKLLAIYNATDDSTVWKMRTNPELLEELEKQSASTDSDEAAEDLAFFMKAVARFSEKLMSSMPKGLVKATTAKQADR